MGLRWPIAGPHLQQAQSESGARSHRPDRRGDSLAWSPPPSCPPSCPVWVLRDRDRPRDESHSVTPGADRPVAPPSGTTPPPATRIVGPLVLARAALLRHGQAKAGASHGACFPSAFSGGAALLGDAIVPSDPVPVLRLAKAVGPTSFSRRRIPASHPLTLTVFRLARQAVTFFSRHLAPVRRPPQGIRRSVHFSPAFQSSRSRFAPLGRLFVLPAALMGFNPSQFCSGRTVPRRFSAAEAHVSFACRIHLDDFGRGIGRLNL